MRTGNQNQVSIQEKRGGDQSSACEGSHPVKTVHAQLPLWSATDLPMFDLWRFGHV